LQFVNKSGDIGGELWIKFKQGEMPDLMNVLKCNNPNIILQMQYTRIEYHVTGDYKITWHY
jgi:hypothetical protein